jgi:spore germination protein KB
MKKDTITLRHAVSMITLFIVGSSLVIGLSRESKQDAWISILIAIAAVMPIVYVYARLMSRYPGMNLFDICMAAFGKILGKILIVLYVWYAIHLGSLILRNFSEFIQVTAFNEMPQTISLLAFIVLIIWVVKRGPEVLGRWASITLPILLFTVLMTILLLIKDMHLSNLLPVGENLHEVPRDTLNNFSFPFAETVLFIGMLNTLKQGEKPGKAWLYGILIGGAVLLFGMFFRNALTLGFPLLGDEVFPSYGAVSIIIAGSVISRIENIVGANLLMAGFVKISVCLMAASKGMAKLFDAEDYRAYVAPLGLCMVALACIVYKNIMEMFDFLPVYAYYAFPFQVLLPIALCITAEIKFLVKNKKEQEGEAPA